MAAYRLVLAYGGCWLLLPFLLLQWHAVGLSDWALARSQLSATIPAAELPFLGINVELTQYQPDERRAALARLRANGFGWARQRLEWSILEPAPNQYDWQSSDAILADMVDADLIPVALLDGSPAWARDPRDLNNPLAPPTEPTMMARFAEQFALRYGDQVRYYQIWDEPNIAPHWGERHIEPVAYAQLLKATATAIRRADPDAVILTAALAPTADRGHTAIDEVYFLQRLYAAGAAPYFDAVAVQPFGFADAPTELNVRRDHLNFQRIRLVRQTMLAAGDGATPIWAVRYGWNTHPNSPWRTVAPDEQRAFAVQALNLAATRWPWLATLGWAIDRPAAPSAEPWWGFALTPALANVLWQWRNTYPTGTRLVNPAAELPPWRDGASVLIMAGGLCLLAWRGMAAARVLPWSLGQRYFSAASPLVYWLIWGGLLLIYYFATWPPLIGLCYGVAAWLLWTRPQVGLFLCALLIPFYFQHKEIVIANETWTVAPAHAILLCLLPALWRTVYARGRRLLWPRCSLDWLALLWLVLNLLAALNVWHWPAYNKGLYELMVMPLLFYCALRSWGYDETMRQRVGYALWIGGVLVALWGLSEWLVGGGTAVDGVRRLVGPYFSPNQTALLLGRTLFVGLGILLAAQGRWRWLSGGGSTIVAVALLLTVSRGALVLGAPVGLLILGERLGRTHQRFWQGWARSRGLLVAIGVIGLAVGSAALWWLAGERLTNSQTVLSRWQIWQSSWHLWLDYPLLGAGPGGFFWRYPAYLTGPTAEPNLLHPHNVWLELATGWGGLGLCWLLALLLILLRSAGRVMKNERISWQTLGLVAGLAAALAHAQVDAFTVLPDLALWNWAALALLATKTEDAARPPFSC